MTYLMNTLKFQPRTFVSGKENFLIDSEGDAYLDFYTDTGTASLGYNGKVQRDVLRGLLSGDVPLHSPNVFEFSDRNKAARRVAEATGMSRVFFCNSGAEAVEAAIKVARLTQFKRGTGRVDIWGWRDSFHGRSLATLALGDGPEYHRRGFGPLPPGFCTFNEIEDIRKDAAAVCLAPVYGNYDLHVYDIDWLCRLAAYCLDNGILLIFDEVMTGAGRTGHYTYGDRIKVEPDIIAMAKGMAGGAPVGACAARGDASIAFEPGTHFSTFGGSPFSCAFVNAMLDWLQSSEGRPEVIEAKGMRMREGLQAMPWAENVRGVGLLNGFNLVDVDKLHFARQCLERNLLVGLFRPGPGPVKITPPLTITDAEIDWGLQVMDDAYRSL